MGKSQHGSKDKAPSPRALRLNENVRYALSTIIARGEIHDPDLANVPITVSEVRVSTDMRNAVVFVMPLGGVDQDMIVAALNKAGPYLRGQLSRRVKMKYLPKLDFRLDISYDEADHISALLSDPKVIADVLHVDDDEE